MNLDPAFDNEKLSAMASLFLQVVVVVAVVAVVVAIAGLVHSFERAPLRNPFWRILRYTTALDDIFFYFFSFN